MPLPTAQPVDFMRAHALTAEVDLAIDFAFEYQPWDEAQSNSGRLVRNALATAVKVIVTEVPPGPTRTRAINMCFDARMLANAAITFRGKS
jgi:hypothetical protein